MFRRVSSPDVLNNIKEPDHIAEQIIRPTGLLDPITKVYPKSGNYEMLKSSVDQLLKKKPHVAKFFK